MENGKFKTGQNIYRINSYYWQGMVYEVIESGLVKTLCKIKGSKSTPKWILNIQLSDKPKQF